MAKVRILNMMFYGFHGVYEYEREQGQKFYIDVEIETENDKVAETDDVKDGVDPAAIYDIVKDVTENKRFQMLGTLAAHIGDSLLDKYSHFRAVTTRIRKPSVPISGPIDYVEAEMTRTRA
ncbi:dihydroneopterin aldolase [Selenomonas montiformis]|uniref:7,8-dihydroneopterin aldolase n=1 Tax=Selenomonas montiformis TaxID=2652285 RepID=A0A6I2UWP3_9FIRM|nr:dihydroneopterin aldolase [Selenomonas montiformis]MDY4696326.1 dihydroneopterin aldolase [Selenomonas montiformis]MSV24081.1 dihydroneopterin aldolase [Selenomonas montiformis]